MLRYISCKRNRQIKTERYVRIVMCEAVYLFFRFASRLCQKYLGIFEGRSVERDETESFINIFYFVLHVLKGELVCGKQFNKALKNSWSNLVFHGIFSSTLL